MNRWICPILEAFIKQFDGLVTAVKKLSYVSGLCYTQLADVQQKINGIKDINYMQTRKVGKLV